MEKVSLQSKSNTSLDPSSYPKDLDPFGEDEEDQSGQTKLSCEVIKPSAPDEPSYPGTLDPFAEEDEAIKDETNGDIKSLNHSNRSSKRVSTNFNQEKDSNVSNSNGGVSLETSITSRASDYDESLDPFGGDDDNSITSKTKADDRKSIVDTSFKELRKSGNNILGETSGGGNRVTTTTTTNDNLSIKSETESSSSGELIKRGVEERNSYSNQNSPVPVPPRRKHRNVSPSTKSLNRASYSASSLERDASNVISSPSSPDPNRLSTVEADSYLSHSTSNLSIRSISPNTSVRSPIRSRKKRRAPDPPGFPPTVPSNLTSPVTPDTSLTLDQDTTIETTMDSTNETINDSINELKKEITTETPCEVTPTPTPEPVSEPNTITDETNSEPIKESNKETPIECNPEPEIKVEKEIEKETENEKDESNEPEIDHVSESTIDQKQIPSDEIIPSESTSEKTNQPESQTSTTITATTIPSDLTADPIEQVDQNQSKTHQDSSSNL
ncbi:uncharacterized protein LOC128391977 [Panonychus citri]|uniref:uncharacterized protein LOC128391977 n=1 Tax=Panonychus citri TaxID=50023 RepID=UPI0023076961|nr:uncharacterized protein LOC128391977 [Panonychus citri]